MGLLEVALAAPGPPSVELEHRPGAAEWAGVAVSLGAVPRPARGLVAAGLARVSRSGRLGALPVALLLLCCLVWGLNQVAIKISLAGVSPLMGAGLRSLVAAALVWLWCGLRGEPLFRRDGTGAYGLLIGLLFAAEFALIYWGLAFTTASRSVIFLYSAPFFVALGAHRYIPGERLTGGASPAWCSPSRGSAWPARTRSTCPRGASCSATCSSWPAGCLWGATTVVIKMGGRVPLTPPRTLFYQLAISSVALIGASRGAARAGRHRGRPRRCWPRSPTRR